MTGRQHAVLGVGVGAPVGAALATGPLAAAGAPNWLIGGGTTLLVATSLVLVLAGALLGAVLPDLDTDRNILEAAPRRARRRLRRRPWLWLPLAPALLLLSLLLGIINRLVMLIADHRGLTHGLTAWAAVSAGVGLATTWLVGPALAVGVSVGYLSHLLADGLTPRGLALGAPWSWRQWHLLPRPLRFGADSWRAGCLSSLLLAGGLALAAWLVWRAAAG
jgi:membrane-bound metal-dependent hydrolase YbcI (DUF457 family)